jgi:hypothetical protein
MLWLIPADGLLHHGEDQFDEPQQLHRTPGEPPAGGCCICLTPVMTRTPSAVLLRTSQADLTSHVLLQCGTGVYVLSTVYLAAMLPSALGDWANIVGALCFIPLVKRAADSAVNPGSAPQKLFLATTLL